MRRVVAAEFVSVDGVMEEPSWTAPFWSDELGTYQHAQLFTPSCSGRTHCCSDGSPTRALPRPGRPWKRLRATLRCG